METNVIKEPLAIHYESVFPNSDIMVSWQQLRDSQVGTTWSTEDGDRYVNCECRADVSITVVYKDEVGCAVLQRVAWDDDETRIDLTWFDFN